MNDLIGQPYKNKRRESALNRNYNCCTMCKRHRQKCEGRSEGSRCKRCSEHDYECEISPSNNRLGNNGNFRTRSTIGQEEDQDAIPDDSILYMKQSEDSSSRYFILHKKVDKGTEYVYATECDDCDGKLRPVKEPVPLGSIASVFQKMQDINNRLSIQDLSPGRTYVSAAQALDYLS